VTRLTDAAGATLSTYRYDAFGAMRSQTGSSNTYGFTFREREAALGLYFNRARYYDTSVGRFMTKDPAGMIDSPNPYTYARNNPASCIDPSGSHACSWWEYIVIGYWWCRTHHTDWGCVLNCVITLSGNRQWIFNWCWFIAGAVCAFGREPRACAIALAACVGIEIGMCIDTCTPRF